VPRAMALAIRQPLRRRCSSTTSIASPEAFTNVWFGHFAAAGCYRRGGPTRKALLVLRELYASRQALDDALASGSSSTGGAAEQFELLDELLATLARS